MQQYNTTFYQLLFHKKNRKQDSNKKEQFIVSLRPVLWHKANLGQIFHIRSINYDLQLPLLKSQFLKYKHIHNY